MLTASDVMTAHEVADLLRIPKSTVYYLARIGKIPSTQIGKHRIFIRQQIEEMLLGKP